MDEHHDRLASVGSVATLSLGEAFFGNGLNESVEQYCGKYFASDGW